MTSTANPPSCPFYSHRTTSTAEKILVVDDDLLVLKALEETIRREGYEVITAQNGKEAIQKIHIYPIAVIICDQRMPDMSGTDVLRKALELRPDAIRIVLTGNSDLDTVLQAINIGQVSQIILKPWEEILLRQTIQTSMEKYRLLKLNQDLQSLILAQHTELTKTHEMLRNELQLGAKIHESLLLGKVPRTSPFNIAATTIPSEEIDGDFFEFYRPNPIFLDVILGDVMGKGIPAALVGIAVKTQLMRFAIPFMHTQVFESEQSLWHDDLLTPKEIMAHVHQEVSQRLMNLEYFVCLFYGRFNLAKRVFSFVNCGTTRPIHYKSAQKKCVQLNGSCFPIGVIEDNSYMETEIYYENNDILVFYSDGVTEAQSPDHELYGTERLMAIIEDHAEDDAQSLLNKIKKDVMSFVKKDFVQDDLTILVIRTKDANIAQFAQHLTLKLTSELSQLDKVRKFVESCCKKAPGNSERLGDSLQLAINEAFCNIATHGYDREPGNPIIIQADLQEEGILFQLSDRGKIYDPTQIPDPDFTGEKTSGFGWYIVKGVADRISYSHKESAAGWNHLQIFKRYLWDEEQMELEHKLENGTLIITPLGSSLDAKDAQEFKDRVITIISNDNANHVIFDLHNLNFIDSSGLGSFLSVLRVLHTRGGELKLASMNKPIRTMFELVSMHKIFEIFHTKDDAIRSFNL